MEVTPRYTLLALLALLFSLNIYVSLPSSNICANLPFLWAFPHHYQGKAHKFLHRS